MDLTRARRSEHETGKQKAKSHGWLRVGLGICLIACSGAPEPQATATPASSAMVTALRDTVRGVLTRALADTAFPGAIAIVGNRQGELVEVEVGHLTWGEPAMVDRHTRWDLATLTKDMGTTATDLR